ncbi:MAG: FAD:protein FMN transferase [Desulfuromonadales bacterium]
MSPALKRTAIIVLLITLLLLAAVLRLRSAEPAAVVHRQRIMMGTVVEITARGADRARLEPAVAAAFAEMARIEALMGPAAESDAARLSRAADSVEVAAETAEVIAFGLRMAAASSGAFDLTLGRLKALWAIESERPRVPAAADIRAALAGTGPGALTLAGRRVSKSDPALAIDLGGIAKGYAIDRAIETLRRAGVNSASVNAGGDIRLLGDRGEGPWRIGIEHPRRPGDLLAVVPLADRAIVSSGDYERYFEQDGRRYHHLFDPATGYPAAACQSVTVLAASAIEADVLATAVFVLGPEKGFAFLQAQPGVDGLIIAADGRRLATSGLWEMIEWR